MNQRMIELGQFFNALLSKPEIASVHLVMTYFVSARADKESEGKIIMINKLIESAKKGEKTLQPQSVTKQPSVE